MEYLNKLVSTVSSVKSQVSTVLPGNPVTREHEINQHIASAGPGLVWKIYSGTKKSTKQAVSVWLLEKRDVENWPRRDRELMLEAVKRGVSQLTRLRHPRLLIIQNPLEESRDSLAFATEPVFCSLANALGRLENMPSFVPSELTDYALFDVEIRHGFMQLAEALSFLHCDAHILHRFVTPESVIIAQNGSWKLAGFEFCSLPISPPGQQPIEYAQLALDNDILPCCQPSLDYLAPEIILGGRLGPESDMFSLGVLAYAVFNKGRPVFDNQNNLSTFKRNAHELKSLPVNLLRSVPEEFREYVKMCLNFTPDLRPDANQFTKISYFDNLGVKTLNFLESICQLDNLMKSQFFKGLTNVLTTLPKRVLLQKVLPILTSEFQCLEMIPFVLPSVLLIVELASQTEYTQVIQPALIPVFLIKQPIQISLILLQRMELLLSKTAPEDVRKHLLPIIYGALESDNAKTQELCLSLIPGIANLIDRDGMKNQLLPRLMNLSAAMTSILSVRVNCLVCVGKLLDNLEKWMVSDQILPALPKINCKEPAVLMAILGIYKMAFESRKLGGISKDQLAKSALPFLVPMCVENTLNLAQFNQFMTLIRAMLDQVDKEQKEKLAQLSALQETQRSLDFNQLMNSSDASKLKLSSQPGDALHELIQQSRNDEIKSKGIKLGGGGGPLTLEEKQRLAREQEQTLRLRQQVPLNPKLEDSKSQHRHTSSLLASKDFTANLMEKQLGSIGNPNFTAVQQPQPNRALIGGAQSPIGSTAPIMTSSSSMTSSSPLLLQPTNSALIRSQTGFAATGNSSTFGVGILPMSSIGTQSSTFSSSNGAFGAWAQAAGPMPTVSSSATTKPDLRAFDDLLKFGGRSAAAAAAAAGGGGSKGAANQQIHQKQEESFGAFASSSTTAPLLQPLNASKSKTNSSSSALGDLNDLLG